MSEGSLAPLVECAATLLAAGEDDEAAVAAIVAQGCDALSANLIVELLPSAFAEPILKEMGARRTETYSRFLLDGSEVRVPWAEDPVWIAVSAYVRKIVGEGRWDELKSIATASSEIGAIEDMQAQGGKVAGSAFALAFLFPLPPDSPLLPASVRRAT